MRLAYRIIAGALAFAITAVAVDLTSLPSNAEGTPPATVASDPRIAEKWEGFKDRQVIFDTVEGAADTSWYDEYAGTAEDPYIISSAEEFMGIALKSATLAQDTDNRLASFASLTSNLDYLSSGTYYVCPKFKAVRDLDNWSSFTNTPAFTYQVTSVDYEYETMEIEAGPQILNHYYATKVVVNYTINGQAYSEDVTGYVSTIYSNIATDGPFYVPPVAEIGNEKEADAYNSAVEKDWFDLKTTLATLESSLSAIRNTSNWVISASYPAESLSLYYKGSQGYSQGYSSGATQAIRESPMLLGELEDFDIVRPTITAGSHTIAPEDYDSYWILSSLTSRDSSVASTKTSLTDSLTMVYEVGKIASNRNVGWTQFEESPADTDLITTITNRKLKTVSLVAKESRYYYWQKTDSTKNFDIDDEFYYIYIEKGTPLYTYDFTVSVPNNNTLKLDVVITDILGNTRTETKTWTSLNTNGYYYFEYFCLYLRYNSNGTVTYEPTLQTRYYKANSGYTRYTNTPAMTSSLGKMADVSVLDYSSTILDVNDSEYVYADIADTLTFRGYSSSSPVTRKNIINRNKYLTYNLPTLVANAAPDPTFKGKYFKLACDIELPFGNPVFPYSITEGNTSAGMSADFDLGGHIIKYNTTVFGHITKYGRLHNGYVVGSYNAQNSTNDPVNMAFVAENNGIIENITLLDEGSLYYTVDAFNKNRGICARFVGINYGNIQHLKAYMSPSASSTIVVNAGTIKDYTYVIVDYPNGQYLSTNLYSSYVVAKNTGLMEDVLFTQDVSVLSHFNYTYLMEEAGGTIRNFDVNILGDATTVNSFANHTTIKNITGNGALIEGCDWSIWLNDSSNNKVLGVYNHTSNALYTKPAIIRDCTFNLNMPVGTVVHQNKSNMSMEAIYTGCAFNVVFRPERGNYYTAIFDYGIYNECNFNIDTTSFAETDSFTIPVFYEATIFSSNIDIKGTWKPDGPDYALFNNTACIGTNIRADKFLGTSYGPSLCGYATSFMQDCITDVGEWSYTNYCCDSDNGSFGYSGGQVNSNNDYILRDVQGMHPYIIGSYANCRFWFNVAGELLSFSDECAHFYHETMFCNNEIYYTFEDTASGEIGSILTGVGSINNCFVYIDEMPEALKVSEISLLCTHSTVKNLTVIAPRINLDDYIREFAVAGSHYIYTRYGEANYNGAFAGDYDDQYRTTTEGALENFTLYTNIYLPETHRVESVAAYYNAGNSPSATAGYPMINGLNAQINVFEADGSPANIAVNVVTTGHYNNFGNFRLSNIVLRSNTLSGHSAIFSGKLYDYEEAVKGSSYRAGLFWNCFMDLPNAQASDTDTPSAEAEYATPGFFGNAFPLCDEYCRNNYYNGRYCDHWGTTVPEGYTSLTEYKAVFPSILAYTGSNIMYSRCYLPENHSALYKFFFEDETMIDSWNVTEGYIQEQFGNNYNGEPIWSDPTEHFDFDYIPEGISFLSEDAYTNGQLAYMLDKGDAGVRRTYMWSVVEPDTKIYNSLNNEELYTLPVMTWLSKAYLPTGTVDENINLKPVFKSTMKPADQGYVEIKGINDTTTTDGDIYVKQGTYIINDVVPESEDVVLIYANQKLGTAAEAKIPNTPLISSYRLRSRAVESTYDISGYKQQGIDTVITPVFKTARYITIDITGSENGTIVPSAYVTAEGEKITLEMVTNPGYIVNDIQINGVPLTEMEFYMPDEDVNITGTCVPFEGGITEFTLFGISGVIDQIAKTITLDVPKSNYVTNALPSITYIGDYIVPSTNTRVDFTNPVDYTVYYGNNQSVTYTVTVNQSDYTMRIYDFVLNGVHGEIDQANRTIDILLPADTDLRNLTPDDISYSAETITPTVDEAQDFTLSQIYTLYTTGMTPVSYVVNAEAMGSDTAVITSYIVSGYEGIIDEENSTITLNVPEGMDLTSTVPDLITYAGKIISPAKIATVNLDDNTTYDVTSQSDKVRTYSVNVNYVSDDEAHIDKFELAGYEGIIDEDDKTITVVVPKGTNVTGIAPDVVEYTGKSIYPAIDKEQDFTLDDITYTVIAPDNTEVEYSVIVTSPDTEAKILEYAILGFEGVIDQDAKTIVVEIPYGVDITDTPPSKVIISEKATITPSKTAHQDFTDPVTYDVTSGDGSVTNTYTVTVDIDYPDSLAKIIEFWIDEYPGEIDEEEGIITVTLPADYPEEELKDKIPEIVWCGEDITPDEDEPQDFTQPVEYTVTAEDPLVTKDYVIKVVIETPNLTPVDKFYNIIIDPNPYGEITSTHTVAKEGTSVTVSVTPYDGYEITGFFVDGDNKYPQTTYTFSMPPRDVHVSAVITEIEKPVTTTPVSTTTEGTTPPVSSPPVSSSSSKTTTAPVITSSSVITTTPPITTTPDSSSEKSKSSTTTAPPEYEIYEHTTTAPDDDDDKPKRRTTTTTKTIDEEIIITKVTDDDTPPPTPPEEEEKDENPNSGIALNLLPPMASMFVILITGKKPKRKSVIKQ